MKYKALFIHIPKTAGSSISSAPFILKYGSFGIPATTEFDRSMTRFTFVRNPYTRFISAAVNLYDVKIKDIESFTRNLTLKKILEDDDLIHLRPMWWYIQGSVDFIGRFENLQQDWGRLCHMIGEKHQLPHHNKSQMSGMDYMQFITPEMRKHLFSIYERDFEYGYSH